MLVICVITVLVCFVFESNTYRWVSNASIVNGQVIEIVQRPGGKNGKSYSPKITYEIDDEIHEYIPRIGSRGYSQYKLGESVKIVVSQNRERVSIFSLMHLYGIPLLITLIMFTITLSNVIIIENGDVILHLLHPHLS